MDLENRMLIDSEWETLEHESPYEREERIIREIEELGLPVMTNFGKDNDEREG